MENDEIIGHPLQKEPCYVYSKKSVLVLVGQTPPPYNGQTVMIEVLRAGLQDRWPLEHVRMSYSASIDAVGKPKISKILKLFALIRDTRRALKRNPDAILYYPPASPNLIPIVRDILFLPCVRHLAKHVVYHYHAYGMADYLEHRPFLSKLALFAYGQADLAVVPTQSCQKDPLYFNPVRVEIIANGRNVPAEGGRIREEGVGDALKVLFVGIHTEGKGFFDLIETANRLVEQGIPVRFRCAGTWANDAERTRAEKMLSKYGLERVVTLLGNCVGDELWHEYVQADVLFFPTQYALETQGMVVVEAMAFGLPIVASRWRGPRDVVVDGETGILCEAGSVEAYGAALTGLQKDIEKRKSMGMAGRKRYEAHYTEEVFIDSWVRLFSEIGG